MKNTKKAIVIIIVLIAIVVIVCHRSARAATMYATTDTTTQPQNTALFCPHISDMKKSHRKGNWTAETKQGLWKSYGLSFATRITQFIGAQWVGANVGQVTCIYKSEQEFTMQGNAEIQPTIPVLLVFHTLVFQPTEGKWKYVKNGVYNCISTSKADCPFKMNVKPKMGDIYDEAESLKSKSNSLQEPSY